MTKDEWLEIKLKEFDNKFIRHTNYHAKNGEEYIGWNGVVMPPEIIKFITELFYESQTI